MASLVSFRLLLFISFSLTSSFSSSASRNPVSDSQKVSLGVYYEALCPYSANFFVNYLAKIFDNRLISIVDLNLVPYGNARIRSNATITCQHGPSECLLNTVEACGISVWPDVNEHFPFINCIESVVYDHKYPLWEKCFEKLQLDPKPIVDCYTSGYGKQLELQYAAETNSLKPPHKYVPWIVVDGQPLYEDYENFESYVCKAYKGAAVLEICSELNVSATCKMKAGAVDAVTYAEGITKPALSTKLRSVIMSWMRKMTRI